MSLELFLHPLSSYCHKVLIAFYENDIPFTYRTLEDPEANAELEALWPLKRFPVLADGDVTVIEATSVIEHLVVHHPGPVRLIPQDPALAAEVRMLDRFFDNYVMTPQGAIVFSSIRPPEHRDRYGEDLSRAMLEKSYAWLEERMAGREWAVGDSFSLADCAAAPSLFYADWTHRIPAEHANVHAYRARLLKRPSFARCIEEARPFRSYFPLGAPDRD